jgi:hypothetical protein
MWRGGVFINAIEQIMEVKVQQRQEVQARFMKNVSRTVQTLSKIEREREREREKFIDNQ